MKIKGEEHGSEYYSCSVYELLSGTVERGSFCTGGKEALQKSKSCMGSSRITTARQRPRL
jgi:hypothetical protein